MIDVSTDGEEVLSADDLDSQFGSSSKPTQVKKFEKTNYFTFKNGDNVYRIMPPMFSALESGHWSVHYAKHFGYFNENGKQVNFVCLREYDNAGGGLTQDCPFCLDQEKKKKTMEKLAVDVNDVQNKLHEAKVSGNADEAARYEQLLDETKMEWQRAKSLYNPRNARFWVNAMNKNGEFGLLPLPKTVYEALLGKRTPDPKDPNRWVRSQGLIAKTKEKNNLDPLSVNEGVWLVVSRIGSGQYDTEYTVAVLKEEIQLQDGTFVEKVARATLSEQQKREAITKCKDLNKVFDHLILTPEAAKAVVNGSGKSVDAVMNAPIMTDSKPVESKPAQETRAQATPPGKLNHTSVLDKFRKLDSK